MKRLTLLPIIAVLLAAGPAVAYGAEQAGEKDRQKVLGIGGFFFRAEHPGRLAQWYERYLGIAPVPANYGQRPWAQEGGPTVFAPFAKNTTYFGGRDQAWMVNFRVSDLKAMVRQLRAAGIAVEDPKSYPNGDFARLHDPEGNPIELWQPREPR